MELARILNAFIMAAVLALIYYRRNWYFAEHAVVALYYLSFASLLDAVLWPLHIATGGLGSRVRGIVTLLLAVPYLWMMLRRVYKDPVCKTTLKTLFLYVTIIIATVLTTVMSLALATIHTLVTIK
jgi:hypothetical protein